MNKIRLAVSIGDAEYQSRLVDCLMKHYKDRLELHVFEEVQQLLDSADRFDLWLAGDYPELLESEAVIPVLYLCEDEPESKPEHFLFAGKYQKVNHIVELLTEMLPEEECRIRASGEQVQGLRIAAVYSLSENEYQLPFAMTLGALLEEETPILVDLQENSGITQIMEGAREKGLEELLLMAAEDSCSKKMLASCIGHGSNMDYVYPAENAENLCETDGQTYIRMLNMLRRELGYERIILNLGSRFSGFIDLLKACSCIYLLGRENGMSRWREQEFMEEITRRGCPELRDHIQRISIPIASTPSVSFERLVEQWKWNEMGDLIRRVLPRAVLHGRTM